MHESPSHPFMEIPHTEAVYAGRRFSVYHAEIADKHGKLVKREAIIHPGAVVILPIVDESHVVMIRNERIIVGKTLWELPAGTLEPKESPLEAAYRELAEETGYQASQISFLTSFYSSAGICDEKMFIYAARDLRHVGQKLDDTEKISVEILSWKQILDWIRAGTIQDGKTLATLLFYKVYCF
ncbi:NUDIX hydrolase [Parachlamydia sp. AcF125]|uniref:NUDIX hydrolase n=1 Tax=Parachlamydia sp. AcF125 TaxID=2795736 RepID=UPI001BC94093|nr:NUDIX hydrolase [Parachlamydia sp. AcF125]MBS4168402.1 ADP-ribose pyrophosphatase [Parachlamydia sp. AcF125]